MAAAIGGSIGYLSSAADATATRGAAAGKRTPSVSWSADAERERVNVVESATPDVGADVSVAPREGAWTTTSGARVCSAETGLGKRTSDHAAAAMPAGEPSPPRAPTVAGHASAAAQLHRGENVSAILTRYTYPGRSAPAATTADGDDVKRLPGDDGALTVME